MHVFHTVSKECFDWLSRQKSVKEESLTDWLLYRVSQLTPCVQYLTFTRNEEASIGADWEWWIITKDCCEKRKCAYRFLVQAKKLHPMKDNYPGLAYCNRNGLQIDLLYEAAKQRRAMPLYILYSANRPDYREQRIHMPNEYCDMLLKWCKSCINGVYFASVYQIRELLFSQPRPQIPDQSILNRSLGLSVLDRFLFDRKELRHMGYYADEPFGKRFCDAIDNAANNRYFEEDFPAYLSVLLREGIANCAGLVYFEVKKDGSVTILDYSASSMRHQHEHSCVAAYSRASIGESALYVCCHKNSYDLTIYRITELEAFADSLGIIRKNTHVHDIVWEYSERQPESKRYAQIKVSFRCGCKVGIKNARTITRELNEQYGLLVLLNSFPSFSTSEPELRVERNSLDKAQ